ncbi:hypothetical protein U1Q18_036421 [Sarracenia purpurea var. burkii]
MSHFFPTCFRPSPGEVVEIPDSTPSKVGCKQDKLEATFDPKIPAPTQTGRDPCSPSAEVGAGRAPTLNLLIFTLVSSTGSSTSTLCPSLPATTATLIPLFPPAAFAFPNTCFASLSNFRPSEFLGKKEDGASFSLSIASSSDLTKGPAETCEYPLAPRTCFGDGEAHSHPSSRGYSKSSSTEQGLPALVHLSLEENGSLEISTTTGLSICGAAPLVSVADKAVSGGSKGSDPGTGEEATLDEVIDIISREAQGKAAPLDWKDVPPNVDVGDLSNGGAVALSSKADRAASSEDVMRTSRQSRQMMENEKERNIYASEDTDSGSEKEGTSDEEEANPDSDVDEAGPREIQVSPMSTSWVHSTFDTLDSESERPIVAHNGIKEECVDVEKGDGMARIQTEKRGNQVSHARQVLDVKTKSHLMKQGSVNIADTVIPSAVNCFEDGEVKGITSKCGPSDGDKYSQATVSSPKQNQPIGATS